MRTTVAGTNRQHQDAEAFLQGFKDSARNGRVRLLRADADYDKAEVRRRNGRVDTVVRLVAVNVRVRVGFFVPLAHLGPRAWLAFQHPLTAKLRGLWLSGPGLDAEDPLDVVAVAIENDPALLADLVLGELTFHRFVRDPAWPLLAKAYHLTHTLRATSDGLWCELQIDLEAY